ncbi:Nucleotidylyl transferase [Gigaspora margarita]|uniref:Nucleotidylyl transferase n=1 Tax=Gigaspora margarita TaxID=4874 RepID=A0A8H4ASQ0_GIGMA|nr:Nucleotidylyl transferase [Gigaspora margarita]
MSKSSYKNSLLQITLPTLTSFNEHHRELIELAVNYSSISLIIHVSCQEIEFYSNYPTECWTKIRDLLNFLYISGTKISYENFKHFLEIDVIFEKWNGYNIELVKEKNFDVFFGSEEEQSRLQEFNNNRKKASLSEINIHIFDTKTPLPPKDLHDQNHKLNENSKIYQTVAVGGTFDHLHAGHKILLTLTAWISGKRLICGVTDDCMLKNKKFKEYIEPINTRIANVSKFLNAIHQNLLYEIVPIYDAYGPTITDPDIHALVVSKETVSGADLVNDERQKRSFGILEIFVIEVISSTNPSLEEVELKKLKLSSTYLRELCKNSEAK